MSVERRQFARQPGPFDGSWNGASGLRDCRITDLSPGGCFVDAPGQPAPGSAIAVAVQFGETRFTLPGEVVYLDRIQGFGVRFLASDQTRALAYAMGLTEPLARD